MIHDMRLWVSVAAFGMAASGAWANATFLAHYDGAVGVNVSLNADYPAETGGTDLYLGGNKGIIKTGGQFGTNCISFPTIGTAAQYDSTPLLNPDAGTAMMWYQMTTPPSGGKATLLSVGTSSGGAWSTIVTNIYLLASYNSSNPSRSSMALVLESKAGSTQRYTITSMDNADSSYSFDLTQWHHYAFTWNVNTATNTISAVLYVDGAATTAINNKAWAGFDFSNGNTATADFNNKLVIGNTAPNSGLNAMGNIDEVAITNDAKSAGDISKLYDLQRGASARELTLADLQSVPEVSSLATLSIGTLWLLRRKH